MSVPYRLKIGLPLLAKELTEQSARRRTYVIRVDDANGKRRYFADCVMLNGDKSPA